MQLLMQHKAVFITTITGVTIAVIGKYILILPGNPPNNFYIQKNYPFKKLYNPLLTSLRS